MGTLRYSGCSAFGFSTTVTPSAGCDALTAPTLHFMGVSAPTAVVKLTLPTGCNIGINVPSISCTLTVTGIGQTIGNGLTGTGGITWTNASPKSSANAVAALVSHIDSSGGGPGCPSAGGGHTGTLSGNYTVTSATNVTVTP
jgi:hypothetical protein